MPENAVCIAENENEITDEKEFNYVYYWTGKDPTWIRDLIPDESSDKYNKVSIFCSIQRYTGKAKPKDGLTEEHICPLYYDLDGDGSDLHPATLAEVLEDTRKLLHYFTAHGVTKESIIIFFSGSKGFHIIVDEKVFGFKPHLHLTKVVCLIASHIALECGLKSFDTVVYTEPRQLRITNSLHNKVKAHRIALTLSEVHTLTIEQIQELAKKPREPLYLEERTVTAGDDDLITLYKEKLAQFETSQKHLSTTPTIKADKQLAPCIKDLLDNYFKTKGNRNNTTMYLAYYFKDAGYSDDEAIAVILPWALKIPQHLTSTHKERDLRLSTLSCIKSIYGNKDTHFFCGTVKKLGVACDNACKYRIADSDYFKRFFDMQEAIDWFDGKFAYIFSGKSEPVYSLADKSFYNRKSLEMMYKSTYPGKDKDGEPDDVLAATTWMNLTKHRYHGLEFAPGTTDAVIEIKNEKYLNLFTGYAVKPVKGDLHNLWTDLLYNVICDKNQELYDYCLTFFAQMVQKPAEKPGASVVMIGPEGVGKGLLMQGVGEIFQGYYNYINNSKHLVGSFNAHFINTLLNFVDEGFWAGDKASEGILKGLITERTVRIEPKGVNSFEVTNHMHFVFASNKNWVVPAGLDARRFTVMTIPKKNKQPYEYYKKIGENIKSLAPHLLDYLLSYDISKGNLINTIKNQALLDQKLLNLPSIEQFLYEKLRNGVLFELVPKEYGFTTDYPDVYRNINTDWRKEALTFDFTKEYILWCKERGQRDIKTVDAIGTAIKKLIQGDRQRYKKNSLNSLKYYFALPDLDTARKAFADSIGHEIQWDASEPEVQNDLK